MKNYIEEFLKDNNIKLGEKFDINSDMYKDFNPYYISYSNNERYDVYDWDEDWSERLLIKLLSGEEKVVKLDSYKEWYDEERNNEDNKGDK